MHKYTLVGDDGRKELLFETREGIFHPTDTSNLLIDACKLSIPSPRKILDLGCGCGIVGIVLARLGLCKEPLFASDISKEAVALAKENASRMSVEYIARCGSLFEPWRGEKFDVIIDDVAGLSDDIAEISSWYPAGVDCNAGRDGTSWIIQVIEQSRQYLAEGGTLIFPVLSLSNEEKILQILKKTYPFHELIIKKDWFLPDEIANRIDILMPLMNDGSIRCQKKYGKWIWSTYVYRASDYEF
ncbi:methyltransferase [Candidatus Poribacteria bacterium]